MSKKETVKFIVQLIASIASAIVTALGATSCIGAQKRRHDFSIATKAVSFNLLKPRTTTLPSRWQRHRALRHWHHQGR